MDATEDVSEDEQISVPISAIEHFSYCHRQCALIHIEQIFEDNVFTIRGQIAHERVESGEETASAGFRVLRSIPLWSDRLGIHGKADVVEFRPAGPYPVEYKSGRRHGRHADLQLCAQALCLEEMLGTPISRGAVYYGALRRRSEVAFTPSLRLATETAISGIRDMLRSHHVPPPRNDARCPNCSLVDLCMPEAVAEKPRLRGLQGALFRPVVVPDGSEDDA